MQKTRGLLVSGRAPCYALSDFSSTFCKELCRFEKMINFIPLKGNANDSDLSGHEHAIVRRFLPIDLNNAHFGPKIDYVAL